MVEFYIRKVLASDGKFAVEDVPKLWREKVRERVETETAGKQEEFGEITGGEDVR